MTHGTRNIGNIRNIGGLILAALLAVACCMAATPPAQAAPADAAKLVLPGDITLAQAQKVIAAAQAKAVEQGTLMNIAVVDAGGNLKAFARMEGAFLGSIDISIGKARTARFFNMSTKAAQPGQPLYGIEVTNGNLVIFGGGELLRAKDGTVIGAVGVSGSSVENDMAVARAGVAALN